MASSVSPLTDNVQVMVRVRPAEDPNEDSVVHSADATSLVLRIGRSTGPPGPATPAAAVAGYAGAGECVTPATPRARRGGRGHRRTVSSPARIAPKTPCRATMGTPKGTPKGTPYRTPARDTTPPRVRTRQFEFDGVFGPETSQDAVFERVLPYVDSVVNGGFNATVLAYGQTGSGKTHTMMGDTSQGLGSSAAGIIPRAVDAVFELIEASPDTQYLLHVTFVELYNEAFIDLLDESTGKVVVRERRDGSTFLAGGSRGSVRLGVPVSSREAVMDLVSLGMQRRTTMPTLMNVASSRSHALFSLCVESRGPSGAKESTLHLIDLAGAERLKLSGATGQTAKEATAINKSLTALGDVLAKLSTKRRAGKGNGPVPYRNSGLTFFLRDSLGGSARTLILATIRSSLAYSHQSKTVLQWATRARKIRNTPVAHTNPENSRIAALEAKLAQQESAYSAKIAHLESLLAARMDASSCDFGSESFVAQIEELDANRSREAAEREALESQLQFLMHNHRNELGEREARVQKLEAALRNEASRSSALSRDLDAALKDLASVTNSLNLNKSEYEEHASKISALTAQWTAHAQAAAGESKALKARLRRERAKRKAAVAAVSDANAAADAVRAERDELAAKLQAEQARNADAMLQIARLLETSNRAQAAKDARIAELEQSNAHLTRKLEAELAAKPNASPMRSALVDVNGRTGASGTALVFN